jgi:hypothetical protein
MDVEESISELWSEGFNREGLWSGSKDSTREDGGLKDPQATKDGG